MILCGGVVLVVGIPMYGNVWGVVYMWLHAAVYTDTLITCVLYVFHDLAVYIFVAFCARVTISSSLYKSNKPTLFSLHQSTHHPTSHTQTLPVGIQLGDMSLSDIALTSTGLLLVLPPNSTHTRNTTTGTPAYTPQASVSAATVDTMSAVGYEMYAELVGQAAAVDGRLTVDGTAFGGVAFALLPAAYDLSLGGEVRFLGGDVGV